MESESMTSASMICVMDLRHPFASMYLMNDSDFSSW